MQRHTESHLDHNLTEEQIAHIFARFADRSAFFIETIELPAALGTAPCALRGPIVGDPPITDAQCRPVKRGDRAYTSRVAPQLSARPSRLVTVIAGPHDGLACILFTAFGGPLSPKEAGDPTLEDDKRAASIEFWTDHALAGKEE